jgi:PilZ domain-containing protein
MNDDQRRELRFACERPAILRRGKRSLEVVTEDVSFRGLFVRMEAPPAVRQLVEIDIHLPPDDRPVRLHGMVVYAILRGRDAERAPGIGVELRGLSGDARGMWESFVRDLQSRAAGTHKRGSARGRVDDDSPALSVREDEVSEETVDRWEDEDSTQVRPLPTLGGRKK